MKRNIAIATLAMISITASTAYASSQIGTVMATSLNVRSGPSTNNTVLFTVKKDEKVEIISSSNGWYNIKTSSGKTGWSSAKYIKINNNESNTGSQNIKVVNVDILNMRSGPSTSYRVIKMLNKDNKVEVISENNGWSKIKSDGRLGYVASRYIESTSSDSKPTPPTNEVKFEKEVTTNGLNVRSGPSTSYQIVGKLNTGDKVGVISEINGWSKITHNGKVAYVHSGYLKNVSSDSKPTPPTNGVKFEKEVTTNGLNVRSGPSTSYQIVGKLNTGDKVGVISESNGWSKINYNDKVAYVYSSYLKEISNEVLPPITGGESTENVNGATINYKGVNYTLQDHVNKQYERALIGGNVIDSSKPRAISQTTPLITRGFVPANRADIEYFLNPNNFTNSKKGMLQFLRIDRYKGGITESELNSYLNSLSPSSTGTNVFYNQGKSFINAAKKYDIDLVYLVSHAMWETAYGKSILAKGQTITSFKGQKLDKPVTVYNFFGIGAIDGSANLSGAEASYANGWTSVEATIDGSAKWIATNYIKSTKYKQNTIYKMKFNYEYTWHQYATDVNWANGISGIMTRLIDKYDTASNLIFEIPNHK